MKTLLKTLIGGALGIGALYVVGKICFEAGKDVAEVERQLKESDVSGKNETDSPKDTGNQDVVSNDAVESSGESNDAACPLDEAYWDKQKSDLHQFFDDAKKKMAEIQENEKNNEPSWLKRTSDKIRNAKMFVRVKKAFSKGDRSPGILSSLLSNPDGAKIEAFVKNGGVQINVTPRTA